MEVDEGLDVPLPVAQELVAHEPEPSREAEHPPAVAQAEIEGEPREAVVRPGEVEEAIARHPLHLRDRGYAPVGPLLRAGDAHHVVGARAAEVLRPGRRLLARGAGIDDEPHPADRELVAEDAVVPLGGRARAVEEEHVARPAGQDEEARAPERARLHALAAAREARVRAPAS